MSYRYFYGVNCAFTKLKDRHCVKRFSPFRAYLSTENGKQNRDHKQKQIINGACGGYVQDLSAQPFHPARAHKNKRLVCVRKRRVAEQQNKRKRIDDLCVSLCKQERKYPDRRFCAKLRGYMTQIVRSDRYQHQQQNRYTPNAVIRLPFSQILCANRADALKRFHFVSSFLQRYRTPR